jgi:hypothetical protein
MSTRRHAAEAATTPPAAFATPGAAVPGERTSAPPPGQDVAKLEPCRASGDENPVGLPDQSAGHHLRELPAGRRQDLPAEVTPYHRRLRDDALMAWELGQPSAY